MNSWNCINTKTIYDTIPDVVPTGEFDPLVDQLLLEEEWTGKIGASYKSESNYYTLSCVKYTKDLDPYEQELNAVKTKIAELQQLRNVAALEKELETLQKDAKDKLLAKEIRESKIAITEVEKKLHFAKHNNVVGIIDDLFLERFDLESKIKHCKDLLDVAKFLDDEYVLFIKSLQYVLRIYKQTRDKEYLRKGVHLLSSIRKERTRKQHEVFMRTLIIDNIGHISEFRRLFDLETAPLQQLLYLDEIYRTSLKPDRVLDPKYIVDATMYYTNRLTEYGEYKPPSSTQDATASSSSRLQWRSEGDEEQQPEEDVAKKNERRDNDIEYKSQREVDYYESKASRWV